MLIITSMLCLLGVRHQRVLHLVWGWVLCTLDLFHRHHAARNCPSQIRGAEFFPNMVRLTRLEINPLTRDGLRCLWMQRYARWRIERAGSTLILVLHVSRLINPIIVGCSLRYYFQTMSSLLFVYLWAGPVIPRIMIHDLLRRVLN